MVIPIFMGQALRGQPITVYGDGSQRRCFCDVRDVVAAITLLEGEPAYGESVQYRKSGGDDHSRAGPANQGADGQPFADPPFPTSMHTVKDLKTWRTACRIRAGSKAMSGGGPSTGLSKSRTYQRTRAPPSAARLCDLPGYPSRFKTRQGDGKPFPPANRMPGASRSEARRFVPAA